MQEQHLQGLENAIGVQRWDGARAHSQQQRPTSACQAPESIVFSSNNVTCCLFISCTVAAFKVGRRLGQSALHISAKQEPPTDFWLTALVCPCLKGRIGQKPLPTKIGWEPDILEMAIGNSVLQQSPALWHVWLLPYNLERKEKGRKAMVSGDGAYLWGHLVIHLHAPHGDDAVHDT